MEEQLESRGSLYEFMSQEEIAKGDSRWRTLPLPARKNANTLSTTLDSMKRMRALTFGSQRKGSVSSTCRPMTADSWRRRKPRLSKLSKAMEKATAAGVWDGYYDTTRNSTSSSLLPSNRNSSRRSSLKDKDSRRSSIKDKDSRRSSVGDQEINRDSTLLSLDLTLSTGKLSTERKDGLSNNQAQKDVLPSLQHLRSVMSDERYMPSLNRAHRAQTLLHKLQTRQDQARERRMKSSFLATPESDGFAPMPLLRHKYIREESEKMAIPQSDSQLTGCKEKPARNLPYYTPIHNSFQVDSEEESIEGNLSIQGCDAESLTAPRDVPVAVRELGTNQRAKYFGIESRVNFFDAYRRLQETCQTCDDETFLEKEAHSPRQAFLREAIRRGVKPLPVILRSTTKPDEVDLKFRSYGDAVGASLAEALKDLPLLRSLNLCDNRLTDNSLYDIMMAIVKNPTLQELNLSKNKIDAKGATALRDYIRSPTCHLTKLILSDADIDDDECREFCSALRSNRSITHLDLSRNSIGVKENLNFVRPEYVTGGEAIAEMLADNYKLTSLDLSWNGMRMESAIKFGKELARNNSLKVLNIAYNVFGNEGSQFVAHALLENDTLRTLDISYNNVTPQAAMVFANSIQQNKTIRDLNLDGNCLGARGGKSLMKAIRKSSATRHGHPLFVHMANANVIHNDADVFDSQWPSGEYKLDLDSPYDSMVANSLLQLANTRNGCNFTDNNQIIHWYEDVPKAIQLVREPGTCDGNTPAAEHRLSRPLSRSHTSSNYISRSLSRSMSRSLSRSHTSLSRSGSLSPPLIRDDSNIDFSNYQDSIILKISEEHLKKTAGFAEKIKPSQGWQHNAQVLLDESKELTSLFKAAQKAQENEANDTPPTSVERRRPRSAFKKQKSSSSNLNTSRRNSPNISAENRKKPKSPMRTLTSKNSMGASRQGSAFGKMFLVDQVVAPSVRTFELFLKSLGLKPNTHQAKEIRAKVAAWDLEVNDLIQEIFLAVFNIVDSDRSQYIDSAEFALALKLLGLNNDLQYAKRCLAEYDVDKSGRVEAEEFVAFMIQTYAATKPQPPEVLYGPNGLPFMIPSSGILEFGFLAERIPPSANEIASEHAVEALLNNILMTAKTESDKMSMLALLTDETDLYLTSHQAQQLINKLDDGVNIAQTVARLLPQMADVQAAVEMVESNLNTAQKLELRRIVGPAYTVMLGNPTGAYFLDLANKWHQKAAQKLVEINNMEKQYSQNKSERKDTSQKHNWENFRNESLNCQPVELNSKWFLRMPKLGKLRFDYVSTTRPSANTKPMSDRRFQQVLSRLQLHEIAEYLPADSAASVFSQVSPRFQSLVGDLDQSRQGAVPNAESLDEVLRALDLSKSSVSNSASGSRISSRRPSIIAVTMAKNAAGAIQEKAELLVQRNTVIAFKDEILGFHREYNLTSKQARVKSFIEKAITEEKAKKRASRSERGLTVASVSSKPSTTTNDTEGGSAPGDSTLKHIRPIAHVKLASKGRKSQHRKGHVSTPSTKDSASEKHDSPANRTRRASTEHHSKKALHKRRSTLREGHKAKVKASDHQSQRSKMSAHQGRRESSPKAIYHSQKQSSPKAAHNNRRQSSPKAAHNIRRQSSPKTVHYSQRQSSPKAGHSSESQNSPKHTYDKLPWDEASQSQITQTEVLTLHETHPHPTKTNPKSHHPKHHKQGTNKGKKVSASTRLERSKSHRTLDKPHRRRTAMPRRHSTRKLKRAPSRVSLVSKGSNASVSQKSEADSLEKFGKLIVIPVKKAMEESDSMNSFEEKLGSDADFEDEDDMPHDAHSALQGLGKEDYTLKATSHEDPLYMHPLKPLINAAKPSDMEQYTDIFNKFCEVQLLACQLWFSVEQALIIIQSFPRLNYWRVIVAVTLFGRIVDLENFMKILKTLSKAEGEELQHRLGILNMVNPMDPDFHYDLDLSHWDEREMCKILVQLAVAEPGENWLHEKFHWSRARPPVPDWHLRRDWTKPDDQDGGPEHHGRVCVTYTSAAEHKCAPDWATRKALMQHVLCGTKRKI